MRFWRASVAALMLVMLVAVVPAAAAPADVTIVARDYAFDMPDTIPAGLVHFTMTNQGKQEHEAQFFRLAPGFTVDQLLKALQGPNPASTSGTPPFAATGGINTLEAGGRQEVVLNLQPGNYVAVCFDSDPGDPTPHVAKGMVKQFTVTGTATAATAPIDGTVTLTDYQISLPAVITQSKALTLQIVNSGPSLHEMALISLGAGKTVQDFLKAGADPTASRAGFTAIGGFAAISPGVTGYVILNLAPGNYVAACFVPDDQGKPHIADGMYTAFTVTAAAPTPVVAPSPPKPGMNFVRRLGDG
ncbi:MAG: hypothetical protein ACYDAR_11470 [Thermomicrobiales bacterium]